jgi:predicted nucleic acid-binding protein
MKRIKVYLDTNIIFGYFLAKVKQLRKKTDRFVEPRIVEFLKKNANIFEYFVSTLVKAELFRRLRTELNVGRSDIEKIWLEFVSYLQINEIKTSELSSEYLFEKTLEIVEETPIKKRVTNLQHLIIAKEFNLFFLTGDKEILDKCKKFYERILSYSELRKYLNVKKLNKNHEETDSGGENDRVEWKESKSSSSINNDFERRVRERSNEDFEEDFRESWLITLQDYDIFILFANSIESSFAFFPLTISQYYRHYSSSKSWVVNKNSKVGT